MTKKNIVIGFVLIFLVIILGISKTYMVIISQNKECKIGIIDTNLSLESKKYVDDGIVLSNQAQFDSKKPTHGDSIVEFSHLLNAKAQIYYYNAIDEESGIITSENIIEGLIWMKENKVEFVNISLSSKRYSKKLKEWLEGNSSDIEVFSSYSNRRNTYDYPAGYSTVIGSGSNSNLEYKENDIEYNSNSVIHFPSMKKYEGNSFLSIISMMDAVK